MASAYRPEDFGLTPILLREVIRNPPLLEAAAAAIENRLPELQILTQLRRQWSAPAARTALTICQMSRRALTGKFKLLQSHASIFYALPEALEQATPLPAAMHKAAMLAQGADPNTMAVDIGCGIGGDAIALARQFSLMAIELSPTRAWMAHRNLETLSLPHVVVQADIDQHVIRLPRSTAVHADPARRTGGRRGANQYFPSLERLAAITHHCSLAAIKISPAADFAFLPAAPLELIAVDGHVVEGTLWLGHARDALQLGPRTATLINGDLKWRLTGSPGNAERTTGKLGQFLFETAGAVTRAGLAPSLLMAAGLVPVSRDACYATGPRVMVHPALRVFEVLVAEPFDQTRLRRAVASLGSDHQTPKPQLEIKTRGGLAVDTDALQRKLAPYARQNLAVIIYPSDQGVTAAITRRVPMGSWDLDQWTKLISDQAFGAELGVFTRAEKFSRRAAKSLSE